LANGRQGMYEKLISRNPLLTAIPHREIKRLMATLRQLEFPPGSVLFREGDYGDRLYIILDGRLDIIKSLGMPDEQLLNVCVPGDYVGEMCLLDPERSRSASVRTSSSVRLLEVTRADLDALIYQYPGVAYAMARVLSQRLRASEAKMSDELRRRSSELSQAYKHLQSLLHKKAKKGKTEKKGGRKNLGSPPVSRLENKTDPKGPRDSAIVKKSWEVRRAIYRSSLSRINIETLGGFSLYRGLTVMDEAEWDGHLPKLLLKAIVTHGARRVPKDQLIEALWPEAEPRSGENNFKITLYRLRKALEPEMDNSFGSSYIHLRSGLINLDEDLCRTDLDEFLSFYRRGEESERKGNVEAALILYNNAIDIYKGDFLPEELYTSWIDLKREELRRLYISLLNKTADIQEKRGTSRAAIDCYKKIIEIDPLSEQAYQKLMILYSNKRMKTEVIRIYKECQKALREELDTSPEALTTSIYNKVMDTE